jgi:hypothetical protein
MKKNLLLLTMLAGLLLTGVQVSAQEKNKTVGNVAVVTTCICCAGREYTGYIALKYNDIAYKIANESCTFTKYGDSRYIMTGVDTASGLALTVVISKNIDSGGIYDIVASFYGEIPSIQILFSSGDTIAEESLASKDNEPLGKIGQLTITDISEDRLSGVFSCRTTHGEITDGRFSVKAKGYESQLNK